MKTIKLCRSQDGDTLFHLIEDPHLHRPPWPPTSVSDERFIAACIKLSNLKAEIERLQEIASEAPPDELFRTVMATRRLQSGAYILNPLDSCDFELGKIEETFNRLIDEIINLQELYDLVEAKLKEANKIHVDSLVDNAVNISIIDPKGGNQDAIDTEENDEGRQDVL